MMRKFSWITLILFIIWIMPLGVFIERAKEVLACDGQRAVCLCSHLITKQQTKSAGKMVVKGGGAHNKEGAGGASHHFLAPLQKDQSNKRVSQYFEQQPFLYSFRTDRSIEPIPKV